MHTHTRWLWEEVAGLQVAMVMVTDLADWEGTGVAEAMGMATGVATGVAKAMGALPKYSAAHDNSKLGTPLIFLSSPLLHSGVHTVLPCTPIMERTCLLSGSWKHAWCMGERERYCTCLLAFMMHAACCTAMQHGSRPTDINTEKAIPS